MRGYPPTPRGFVKEHLRELVAQALLDLRRHGKLPADLATPDYVIERTKNRDHGDYATNVALLLAKSATPSWSSSSCKR